MRPLVTCFLLLLGTAAQGLQVQSVQGSAELRQQGGFWRPLLTASGGVTLAAGEQVRTGAGRLELQSGAGHILLNNASQALINIDNEEVQLLTGQAYVTGPAQLYLSSHHVYVAPGSAMRLDLVGGTQRAAVVSGRGRVAYGRRVVELKAAEQFLLRSAQVVPFQEADPWYLARITGQGEAVLEALRGQVWLGSLSAAPGQQLQPGQRLRTGPRSWAELGFTGGGYLRLQAYSELEVVAMQTSTRGREVLLRLVRGSVWNVVQRGAGGYRISTPVVSTAVRGTVYCVDAGGLVKVFEGVVDTGDDIAGDIVEAGQQRSPEGVISPLTVDDTDAMNLALDRLRALPLGLRDLSDGGRGPLQVQAAPQSQVWLEARLPSGVRWMWPLQPADGGSGDGEEEQPLTYVLPPEVREQLLRFTRGEYTFSIAARRYGQREQIPLPHLLDTLRAAALPQGARP